MINKKGVDLANKKLGKIYLAVMNIFLLITISFLLLLISTTSAVTLNSTTYSGYDSPGCSPGNITNGTYSGESTCFYQQPIGNLNNSLYSGQYSFTSQISTPTPSIIKPENETRITRVNIPLNFTLDSSVNYIWYNLDGGSNTTLNGNTTFNTTNGLHTLHLFVNNSQELNYRNVTFTIDTTKFIVNYSNYSGSTEGASTDFNLSTYEDLQSLSGIILENTNYGKIFFSGAINVTNDSVLDNGLDLDLHTEISDNSIEINSTALPNFNTSARIYLYNLSFTNPRVLRDGVVCESSVCTEINYSGGTFVFSVSEFSTYSAEETPSESEETPASSSGGGGGTLTTVPVFTVNKDKISVTLNPGQVETQNIEIKNTGSQTINVRIDNLFTDFVVRGEEVVVSGPEETKVVPLYLLARIDTPPDIYLGKIILSSGNLKKEILISIEVESKGVLLDVRAEILNNQILPGEEVLAEIRLFNLGSESKRKDVDIEYIIKDYENHEIAKETEALAIETQTTFIKKISIPQNTPLGNYVLYVRAIYSDKIASSSDNFEIVSVKVTKKEKIYIVLLIILILILSLIVYYTILHSRTHGAGKKYTNRIKGEEKISLRGLMKK